MPAALKASIVAAFSLSIRSSIFCDLGGFFSGLAMRDGTRHTPICQEKAPSGQKNVDKRSNRVYHPGIGQISSHDIFSLDTNTGLSISFFLQFQ